MNFVTSAVATPCVIRLREPGTEVVAWRGEACVATPCVMRLREPGTEVVAWRGEACSAVLLVDLVEQQHNLVEHAQRRHVPAERLEVDRTTIFPAS